MIKRGEILSHTLVSKDGQRFSIDLPFEPQRNYIQIAIIIDPLIYTLDELPSHLSQTIKEFKHRTDVPFYEFHEV